MTNFLKVNNNIYADTTSAVRTADRITDYNISIIDNKKILDR